MRFLPQLATLIVFVPTALAQNQPSTRPDDRAALPVATAQVTSGGGVPTGKSRFRVVRSISGTAGAQENGSYIIRDPRTTFHIPQDHRVIVYFEWEGPLGPHRFEGVWKSPDGKITSVSDFDYDAKQVRFGGYWDMLISDNTPTGLWMVQALVDGELTGTHTFQVVSGTSAGGGADAAAGSAEPMRNPLAPSALYGKANASTVTIENRNEQGQLLNTGEGFFIGPGLVLTAFQVIDGASSLRIVAAAGQATDTKTVAAWNRRQDWAILQVTGTEGPAFAIAKTDSWGVGDRCYYLDAAGPGNRVIVATSIVGKNTFPHAGDRISLGTSPANTGIGTALLDEYGDVIGVTGGVLVPGVSTLEGVRAGVPASLLLAGGLAVPAMATPMSQVSVPVPGAKTSTLEELTQTGQFVAPVVHRDDIIFGTMAREVRREKDGLVDAVQEKYEFSRSDGHAAVLLSLDPTRKQKVATTISIFDLDNKAVNQSAPDVSATPGGKLVFLSKALDIGKLEAGVYRLDVVMNGNPVWRTFFRITD
jgi:Trypsin-like peptidase domain